MIPTEYNFWLKTNLKKRKTILPVFIFCMTGWNLGCLAQLNRRDTLKWQTKLAASGSFLDGNVSRSLFVARLELAYADTTTGFSTRIDYQYGRTKHSKTENDHVSYNFIYLHPLATFYPYMLTITETNYRRQIDFRYQVGPGFSYTVPFNQHRILRLSLTGTYEFTRFATTKFTYIIDTLSHKVKVWRLTTRLFGKQSLAARKMTASCEFWWQQSITDRYNYRFYNEEVLEIPLNPRFSFRTAFRFTYENVRVRKLKPYDLFWTFGFSITNL